MLVPDSALVDGERTKVLDFGIAKLQQPSSSLASTRQDLLMGTPGYMSPEQCRGAAGVDARSDVYSLGVVLYRLLAGRMPFVASGAGEIMAMHIYEEPPPLKQFAEWIPDAVAAFAHRLLEKEKTERPSMSALVAEIDRLLVEVPDAKPVVSVSEALGESGPLAVSSIDPDAENESDAGDSDSLMPTVDAGSLNGTPRVGSASQSDSGAQLGSTPSILAVQQRTLFQPARMRVFAIITGSAIGALSVGGIYWQRRPPEGPVRPAILAAAGSVDKPVVMGASKIVHWSVYTEPPGATVVRVSDGLVLGQTPWQSELEARPGTEELRLRRVGYIERLIRLDRTSDATRRDVLEAVPAPPVLPAPPRPSGPAVPAAVATPRALPAEATVKPKHDSTRKKPRNVAIEFED